MLAIWCGPVQGSTLELAKWSVSPPPRVVTVNSGVGGKIGSSAFAALGAEYKAKGGTPLRGLLAAHSIAVDIADPILLFGFSAAHGLIESILATPEDAARVRAVGAFDAYYTSPALTPKPGYLAFLKRAAAGDAGMVMTSSHIAGPDYPSGADAARALVGASGVRLEYLNPSEGTVGPATCESANQAGAFEWFVYKNRSGGVNAGADLRASHVQHATVLAPHFAPILAEEWGGGAVASRPPPTSSRGSLLAAFGLAAGLAYAAHEGWI